MNSKAKGGEFERFFCKFITKWLTGKETPYVIWRSILSGGSATIIKENADISGDVMAIHPEGHRFCSKFNVEIKTGYGDIDIYDHIIGGSSKGIGIFWSQCCRDAEKSGRLPMLVWRKRGKNIVVGVSEPYEKLSGSRCMRLTFSDIDDCLKQLYIYKFDDFFSILTPDDIL